MKKKDKIINIKGVRSEFCELDIQVHESYPDPSARWIFVSLLEYFALK
ncbi:hypothetical protein KAJ27_23410 [bacterium]|nr:hypothetical protein [bacterium]